MTRYKWYALLVVASAAYAGPAIAQSTDTDTLNVKATKDLAYKVYIGGERTMTSGANNLTYEIYSDANRTAAWGSTSGTAESYTSSSGTTGNSITLYGRVASGQDVAAGSYSDTVTVTVEW